MKQITLILVLVASTIASAALLGPLNNNVQGGPPCAIPGPNGPGPNAVASIVKTVSLTQGGNNLVNQVTVKKVSIRKHGRKSVKTVVTKKVSKQHRHHHHHHSHHNKKCGCKHHHNNKIVSKKLTKKIVIKGKKAFRGNKRAFNKYFKKANRGRKNVVAKKLVITKKASKGRKGIKANKTIVATKTYNSRKGRVSNQVIIKKNLKANRKGIRANKTIIAKRSIKNRRGVRASKTVIRKSLNGKRGKLSRKFSVSKTYTKKNNRHYRKY